MASMMHRVHAQRRSLLGALTALTAVMLPMACSEEPVAPPITPSIRLELPGVLPLMSETLVRVRVIAETADEPGALQEVVVSDSSAAGNARMLYWSPSIGDRGRVELDTVVNLAAAPGRHRVFAVMRHIVDNVYRTDTASVSISLYRRATFDFDTPVPDTVYGRSLIVRAKVSPAISAWNFALVMNRGTANEWILSGPVAPWQVVRHRMVSGTAHYEFDVTDTLPNGPHRVSLRLTDELGVRFVDRDFVVHVANARFTVRELPGLSNGIAGASDVNDAGDAVGFSTDERGTMRPMLWPHSGSPVMLPTPDSLRDGQAVAISNTGGVAGWILWGPAGSCSIRPVTWEGGAIRRLELAGAWCGRAVDVNDAGAVLYTRNVVDSDFWNDSSTVIDRGGMVTYVAGVASPHAINAAGQVAGWQYSRPSLLMVPGANFAVSFEPQVRGTSPHISGAFTNVNERSQVVGYRRNQFLTSVFLSQPGHQSVDLTPALGGPSIPALPVWINDAGTVLAGNSTIGYYLWSAGRTQRLTLAETGWEIVALSRTNAAGSIAGQLRKQSSGELRAVVLEPVP